MYTRYLMEYSAEFFTGGNVLSHNFQHELLQQWQKHAIFTKKKQKFYMRNYLFIFSGYIVPVIKMFVKNVYRTN